MLVRMLPHKVAEYWDYFKPLIEKAVPPSIEDKGKKYSHILEWLLLEQMVCWISVNKEKKQDCLVLTTIVKDDLNESKYLFIYGVAKIDGIEESSWLEGASDLAKFALKHGCTSIVSYSDNPAVVKHAQLVGANCDTRKMVIPLV